MFWLRNKKYGFPVHTLILRPVLRLGIKICPLVLLNLNICILCSCRHLCISNFFGDEKPDCRYNCDACSDPKRVEKNLLDLQSGAFGSMNKSRRGGGAMYHVEEDGAEDMYGGGRRGAKK